MPFYEGSVKDGEFWYRIRRFSGNPLAPKQTTRLARVHLESGIKRETAFEFDEHYVLPVWIGDTLFVYTRSAIYQADGNSLVKLEPLPFSNYLSPPFLYDGQMAVVYNTEKPDDDNDLHENVRLWHLIDGKFVEGRRILLPRMGQFWFDDPQVGHKVLFPRTSESLESRIADPRSYFFTYRLIVVQHEKKTHLFLADPVGICSAYRNGFEFADESSELPSALAPENAPHDVSGWEPILPEYPNDWLQMVCDQNGLLFASMTSAKGHPSLVRHHFKGGAEVLTGDLSQSPREPFLWVAVDHPGNSTYVIHSGTWSATIRRIEGNSVQPPHLVVPGFQDGYIARWQRVVLRLLIVWSLPTLILTALQAWYARRQRNFASAISKPSVVLASLWRRAIALGIDLTSMTVVSWLIWRLYLWWFGLVWNHSSEQELADSLSDVEWGIRSGNLIQCWHALRPSQIGWLTIPFDFGSTYFGFAVASVLPVFLAKVYIEGRTGLTLGKWLLKIRTVRSTQRDCGFSRALVRNVAYFIDLPFLLTPLPALSSMLLSDCRQRIGDRIADTNVIVDESGDS